MSTMLVGGASADLPLLALGPSAYHLTMLTG
jgi:hypothetical protein